MINKFFVQNTTLKFALFFVIIVTLSMCKHEKSIPKQKGYFRIDLPEKNYSQHNDTCPFTYKIPNYAFVVNKPNSPEERCMKNIIFPYFKATLYCTYIPLANNFHEASKFSQNIVYEHRSMATGIKEQEYTNYEKRVFGNTYSLEGNVACNYLFYLTDSTHHYFAASLYFETKPNFDSLQPVIEFLKEDLFEMIESFEWK